MNIDKDVVGKALDGIDYTGYRTFYSARAILEVVANAYLNGELVEAKDYVPKDNILTQEEIVAILIKSQINVRSPYNTSILVFEEIAKALTGKIAKPDPKPEFKNIDYMHIKDFITQSNIVDYVVEAVDRINKLVQAVNEMRKKC